MSQMPPENPFMQDRGQQLAMLLMSMGGGISSAAANGLPAWQGIAPGASTFAGALGANAQRQESDALRRWQIGLHEREIKGKEDERAQKLAGMQTVAGMLAPGGSPESPPGMRPDMTPRMGPDSYTATTGQLESGGSYTAPNALGSGAYGKYQFMPDTWADVATKNPQLGLPMNMKQATPEHQEAAMKALTDMNSKALQGGGLQPTPISLYLAHRFGPEGAKTVMASDPNAPISSLFPPKWTEQNPDLQGKTVGQFVQGASGRFGAPQGQQPGATQAQYSPQSAPPAQPPQVPMPMLPAQIGNELAMAVKAGAMTPDAALSQKRQYINDLWQKQQTAATEAWKLAHENYRFSRGQESEQKRFDRGLETEGEWVRGADGVESWQPKSARKPGMTRADKPPSAGTETGDIHILNNGDPSSREYAGAYNRVRTKLVDGPDGFKYAPDMEQSGHRPPTFREEGAPTAAPAPANSSGLPGLVPVGAGKERKYTESQGKDHTYAIRLDNAIPQLEALVKGEDGQYSTARLPSSYERMKGDSDYVPDSMVSERTKAFRGIVKDIVTSTLRRESGASIAPSEFKSEMQKFIPLPGDNDAEIKRKIDALKIAARSIAEGSGRPLDTYKNLTGAEQNGGGAPAGETAPSSVPVYDVSGKRIR